MWTMKRVLILLVLGVVGTVSDASADRRAYVWTYEYKTMIEGEAELESYSTFSTADRKHVEGTMAVEQMVELEIGKTDRFDVSVYQVFKQDPGEGIRYTGFKLRSRYRFGEKGKYLLDPLLYAEYKGKPDFSEHGFELKLILAKDIGRFNVAVNPILELEQEDDEWEVKPEYTLGLSYELLEVLRCGLEFKGSEYGHYVGPVLSHGRDDLWVAFGSAVDLADVKEGKPEFQLRVIMGVGL